MRAVLDLRIRLAGEVVDLVLPILDTAQILSQRHALLAGTIVGGSETQQTGYLLLVREIFRRAFFQYLTELLPEVLVVLRLVLGQLVQHVQHALGQRRLHRIDHRILLQDLAGHVQR